MTAPGYYPPVPPDALSAATGFLWGSIPSYCSVLPLLGRGVFGFMACVREIAFGQQRRFLDAMARIVPMLPKTCIKADSWIPPWPASNTACAE